MFRKLKVYMQSYWCDKFQRMDDEYDDDSAVIPVEKHELERPDWSMNCNESLFYNKGDTGASGRSDMGSVMKVSGRYIRSEKFILIFGIIGLASMIAASCLAYSKWGNRPTHAASTPIESPGMSPRSDPSDEPPLTWKTANPTNAPLSWAAVTTAPPTRLPTPLPTMKPTARPSASPSDPAVTEPTYIPGNLTTMKEGLLLSEGLDARILAIADQSVPYFPAGWSVEHFHGRPDAGATFPDSRESNPGGWIYVSNSEIDSHQGGVGAFTFNRDGRVIDYRMLLQHTTMNCGGGHTPWNTWVSCEEVEFTGLIYQVDPLGQRESQVMTLGSDGGRWESFSYDIRDKSTPHFFATEDHSKGTVRRFTPDNPNWDDPWSILHGNGTTDFLMIFPDETMNGGTYIWTNDKEAAKNNARKYYPMTEGIDVFDNEMFFVCKRIKMLFVLDLDSNTYYNRTTSNGLFDGKPDQVERVLKDKSGLLYFTEEGGVDAGVHARDQLGRFYTVFESPVYPDETTGLSFSPDGRFMYIAYQDSGILYSIWRKDGYPFHASHLDVKFHYQP